MQRTLSWVCYGGPSSLISGKNKTIDYLLNNIKNVNNCDIYGNNLIFDAVSNGDKDLISKISKLNNINKNQKNKEGKTVLNVESVLNNIFNKRSAVIRTNDEIYK